ncbi:MAG: alpha/beta hydrolase-fold protein [Luteibacter sp.]
MSSQLRTVMAATMVCMSRLANANDAVPGTVSIPPEATIESTTYFDFVSTFNHEAYRVKVYIPPGKSPEAGYPTLYVLDGNILFSTFAGAVRNEAQAKEREQAVVVGIESGEGKDGGDRTFDFTPSDLTAYEKKIVVDLGDNPRFGGYENFLRTIQEEIKPRIGQLVKVDRTRDMLLGWSLGGQFVVHTLFVHPEAFSTYIALSPSLWRNDKAVMKEIPAFEKATMASGRRVGLFVGVGGLEQTMTPALKQWDVDPTRFAAEIEYARMVGNVVDFTTELKPFFAKRGLPFYSKVFDGETHNTVPWAAVNPILRFALPAPPAG